MNLQCINSPLPPSPRHHNNVCVGVNSSHLFRECAAGTEELARLYHIPIPRQTDLPISYNIAPNAKSQQRSLDALQWGLIPYWAKDPKIAYRTINARAETVDKAPSYRQAFKKRRCLIPADGFYEWRKTAKPKLPFAIAMKDGRPFTFARLWENWKDPG